MQGIENSVVSKSATSVTDNNKQKLLVGRQQKIDILFPLFDQMNTTVKIPTFITFIVAVYVCYQFLLVTIWVKNPFYDVATDYAVATIPIFLEVFWFANTRDYQRTMTINLIIVIVFSVFTFGWLCFQLYYYAAKRSFIKWTLYVTKIIFDIVAPVLIMPTATFISVSFLELAQNGNNIAWAYLVVGVVCIIIVFTIFATGLVLNSKSIILTNTPFPVVESSGFLSYTVLSACTHILSFIFFVYPDWLCFCTQLIHLAGSVWILIISTRFQFYKLVQNCLFSGFVTAGIVLDVMMCILYFAGEIEESFTAFTMLGLGVIVPCIYAPIYKKVTKKICEQLTYTGPNMTEEEKYHIFDDLGLGVNPTKAIKYLYVGIVNKCDLFVDMSLTSYIAKTTTSTRAVFSLAHTTAFFPSEMRLLNSLFRQIVNRRDIGFADRFMVFQLHRIKVLRASSSSAETNELLIELKNINAQCESHIKGFWTMTHADLAFNEFIWREWDTASLVWKEALFSYPNNSKISFEYSRFLTETMTNFDGAIYQQQRGDLIEGGRNFAVDSCFRSFVRTFPDYLLDEVLDIKGNKVQKVENKKGSTMQTTRNSSNNSNQFTNSTEFTIDAEMEETIGKKILTYSRMRLALHHSIDERRTPYRKWQYFTSFITLVVTIVAFLAIYFLMVSEFETPRASINNIYNIGRIRFHADVSIISLILKWAQETGRIQNVKELLGESAESDITTPLIEITSDLTPQVMLETNNVKNYVDELCQALSDLAGTIDVYAYSNSMLQTISSLNVCMNDQLTYSTSSTFKDMLIYMVYLTQFLNGKQLPNIWDENDMCNLMTNSFLFVTDVTNIANSFADRAQALSDQINDLFNTLKISIPIAMFIITFFPILIVNVFFVKSINGLLATLLGLPAEAKENAKRPIRNDIEDDSKTVSEGHEGCSLIYVFMFFFAVLSIILTVLTFLFVDEITKANINIAKYHLWFVLASRRASSTAEATLEFINAILLTDSLGNSFENRSFNLQSLKLDMDLVLTSHQSLTQGSDDLEAFYGYDDQIDSLTFTEMCTINESDSSGKLHDLYKCASISQQISIWRDFATKILNNPDETGGLINSETAINGIHIMTDHLWYSLPITHKRFVEGVEEIYQEMDRNCIIIMIIAIIIGVLDVFFTLYFVSKVNMTYAVMISLIQHLKPTDIVASKELMNFLLNRKDTQDDKTMGVAQSVIYNAADAIICTGLNGVIEIVNPSVSAILGYTPDQLLGQPITGFFKNEDAETVQKQIELMLNGQSAAVYEDHLKCLSDSSLEVSFMTTIIGMKNEGSDEISSFVFILSDETQRIKQQQEADAAKAKSEKLLYQILPKDIVFRLNRGEKDISFSVPHASIIFIDIVKFSEYAASLTPQEIMGNLSIIFAAFDQEIAKYPKLTKIKLIGDVYMAAGGLFGGEEDLPNGHAEDTVKFGLDCLTELEEVNLKLSASLEVRIGVNTGGPLLAGVLGTDKPVFDIIGDPINIASRLQSTDIPGKVQISQATKDLLEGTSLQIEERGEVFLKGKGKQMTYLVTPLTGFMQITGSLSLQAINQPSTSGNTNQ